MKQTKKFLCAVLIAACTLPCSALAAGAEEQSKTPADGVQQSIIPWESGQVLSSEMQKAKTEWQIYQVKNTRNAVRIYYLETGERETDGLLICRQDRPNGSYRILEAEAFLFDSEIGQEETAYEPMNSGWEDTTAKNGSSYRYRLYFVKEDGSYSASNSVKITRLSAPDITSWLTWYSGTHKIAVPKYKPSELKWTRNRKADGYQIRISRHSSMKDSRVYTVSSGKKNHLTLSKLRSNRKYYAQVRAYVKENHQKTYSSWSEKTSIRA